MILALNEILCSVWICLNIYIHQLFYSFLSLWNCKSPIISYSLEKKSLQCYKWLKPHSYCYMTDVVLCYTDAEAHRVGAKLFSLRVIAYKLCAVWNMDTTHATFRLSSRSIDLKGHLRTECVIFHLIEFALKHHFSVHLFIYLNQTTRTGLFDFVSHPGWTGDLSKKNVAAKISTTCCIEINFFYEFKNMSTRLV